MEIVDGPVAPRKTWLRPGQRLVVGRTEEADFAIAADDQMSGVHFALQCTPTECRIVDRNSKSGTYVNGQPIIEGVLNDGDQITAGQTIFAVRIKGQSASETPPVPARSKSSGTAAGSPAKAAASLPVIPVARAKYTEEKLRNGWLRLRGKNPEVPPGEIVRRLSEASQLYFLINLGLLGLAEPPVEHQDYLFTWLPPDIARELSPIVLSQQEDGDLFELADQAWGKDVLVVLYSRMEKEDLLAHLVRMLRGGEEPAEGSGVLGFYQPKIMAALIEHKDADFLAGLLHGIEAVLVESEAACPWELYTHDRFANDLRRLGFLKQTAPNPGAS